MVQSWLRLVRSDLPRLVKEWNRIELRSRILAYIKPEISHHLTPLLDEIRTADDAKGMRAAVSNQQMSVHSANRKDNSLIDYNLQCV